MRNYILILILLITNSKNLFSQEVVKMTKEGGVYTIPCEVNGLRLKFIFDTGASNVSISLSEALFMLKNDYLSESDIKGSTYFQIANGEIVEGTTIILRELKIGNKVLCNVEASIVHSMSSPLLLGQSALSKIGKFSFNYHSNTLVLGSGEYSSTININTKTYTTTLKMEGKLRDFHGAMSSVIKNIPSGATVRVIDHMGDYWEILYDGEDGFLNDMYLNVTSDMLLMKEQRQ